MVRRSHPRMVVSLAVASWLQLWWGLHLPEVNLSWPLPSRVAVLETCTGENIFIAISSSDVEFIQKSATGSAFFFFLYLSIFSHRQMKTECTDSECIPVLKYRKCPAYCVHQHMDCYFLLVFPPCLGTQQVRYSQHAQSGDWEGTGRPHHAPVSTDIPSTDLMAPGSPRVGLYTG